MKKLFSLRSALSVAIILLYLVSIALFFLRNLPAAFLCFGVSSLLGILLYLAAVNERSLREREALQRAAEEEEETHS